MKIAKLISEAVSYGTATIKHLVALHDVGESVPQIVFEEVLEIAKDAHDSIKERHDEHVKKE